MKRSAFIATASAAAVIAPVAGLPKPVASKPARRVMRLTRREGRQGEILVTTDVYSNMSISDAVRVIPLLLPVDILDHGAVLKVINDALPGSVVERLLTTRCGDSMLSYPSYTII